MNLLDAVNYQMPQKDLTVLLVDDDQDDKMFFQRAVTRNQLPVQIQWAPNGKAAIDYLSGVGEYADRNRFPVPKFIITDTKMPLVSGKEFLEWLKSHPEFSVVPTIILAGAASQKEVNIAYQQLGIHSYIEKPQDHEQLLDLVKRIFEYWMNCRLPSVTN